MQHFVEVFGDADFVDAIKKKFLEQKNNPSVEISGARSFQGGAIVRRIKKEVSNNFKVSEEKLALSKRGETNRPRMIAVGLAREVSGLRLGEVAGYFSLGSYKSVSAHHRNFLRAVSKDAILKRWCEGIKKRYSQIET